MSEPENDRTTAIQHAREAFEELRNAITALATDVNEIGALVDVISEIGEAVLELDQDGAAEGELIEAGLESLEPKDDDNDDLRMGLRWLVVACGAAAKGTTPARRKKVRRK